MDIKTKKRTNNSIELTFSDISTKTTIPLSLSDALQLQANIASSVNNCYKSSPAKETPVITKEEYLAETEAAEKSILGGVDTEITNWEVREDKL